MPLYEHDPDVNNRFIIFDMFGTLVTSRQKDMDDLFSVFYGLFPEQTPEAIEKEYEDFCLDFQASHGKYSEMSVIMLIRHLNQRFGTDVDSLRAEEAMMRGTRMFYAIDGAIDTLRYFKDRGYRIGVLSNTTYRSSVVRGVLEDSGFSGLLDSVMTSADIGFKKPSDEAYSAAVSSLGAEKYDCFFVGDSCLKDCKGPLEFGMRGAFLIDPASVGKRDYIVAEISEIPTRFTD